MFRVLMTGVVALSLAGCSSEVGDLRDRVLTLEGEVGNLTAENEELQTEVLKFQSRDADRRMEVVAVRSCLATLRTTALALSQSVRDLTREGSEFRMAHYDAKDCKGAIPAAVAGSVRANVQRANAALHAESLERQRTDDPPCHPNYSGCLSPTASDYDCAGGSGDGPLYTGTVKVYGSDPFGLDGDGDGTGCD